MGLLTVLGYLAALASSNVLVACSRDETATDPRRTFSEPRIIGVPRIDSGVAFAIGVEDTANKSNLFEYCAGGYRSSGQPRLDIVRLGALCGPVNGLLALEPSFEPAIIEGEARRSVSLKAGQCARAVAAVSGSESTVELEWREGQELRQACAPAAFGWCPEMGLLCVQRDVELQLEFRVSGRVDDAAAQVWVIPPR